MKFGTIGEIILSFPRTICFDFRHFPLKQAIKLPIWIHYRASVSCMGTLVLPRKISVAIIRIGFHIVPEKNGHDETVLCVEKGGRLEFGGTAHIGRGSKIYVSKGGELSLGDNFAISASSSILCYKRIILGKDILFSWDCLVMDSDTHTIYDDKAIILGDKIWIGCRCLILKGATIPSNCVVGANSLVLGSKYIGGTVILGNPAQSVKKIGGWKI